VTNEKPGLAKRVSLIVYLKGYAGVYGKELKGALFLL
jgi:hypothetical protein